MRFETVDPATEEVIAEYETMDPELVLSLAGASSEAFEGWRTLDLTERAALLTELAKALRAHRQEYAGIITMEMGKPVKEALAEVEKCAWTADVYAQNSESWLEEEGVEADGLRHRVVFEPIGTILGVMPWNFPFWQALRFAIPALTIGNACLLRHSNRVPQCALAIERTFTEAGYPEGVFRTVITDHDTVTQLIGSEYIAGVSFTGSSQVGGEIAALAGSGLKKAVLELGGSDPFVVLEDADLDITVKNALLGRTLNAGQSCIAAKRFIVHEAVVDAFVGRLSDAMLQLKLGDPSDPDTEMGPLVSARALDTLDGQVRDAVSKGAVVETGAKRVNRKGFFYFPTVLSGIKPDMKVWREETFGPVAPVMAVESDDEAMDAANDTAFGLGGSVWTRDLERGERLARRLRSGTVFVNCITKSDPRMPFGGIKTSGFGRELSGHALKEFANVKGLNVYEHG